MTTIAEIVGYVIIIVAFLNTLVQVISYLSNEEYRGRMGTWIIDKVNNLLEAAPVPAPSSVVNNNNQTYHYQWTLNKPCPVTINLGNGQEPEVNEIEGVNRLDRTARRVAPDVQSLPSSAKPQITYQAATHHVRTFPIPRRPKTCSL